MATADDPLQLIRSALDRDEESVRALVARLSPVIERRVASVLWRLPGRRDLRQDVRDMTQTVFLSLFESKGKALRVWDPARGTSLEGFVSLLAQRQVISLLRRRRTSPWRDDPADLEDVDPPAPAALVPDEVAGSREHLRLLLDAIREELSPLGLEIFQRMVIDQEPIEELSTKLGKTVEALYQWRRRFHKLAQTLSRDILGKALPEATGPHAPEGTERR